MFNASVTARFDPRKRLAVLSGRLEKAQRFLDGTVARDTEPFVPRQTGALANSVFGGEGRVVYDIAYARRQYEGRDFSHAASANPQATHHWFEAAKARCLGGWGKGVAAILGGVWRGGA